MRVRDEVHIYLICFFAVSRTRFLIPLTLSFFPLFAFTSAGAVDKIVFPVGIQKVDFEWCTGLTGTAKS